MPDYEKMYHCLFNAVTDALELLDQANYGLASEVLKQAQIETERIYVES